MWDKAQNQTDTLSIRHSQFQTQIWPPTHYGPRPRQPRCGCGKRLCAKYKVNTAGKRILEVNGLKDITFVFREFIVVE